MHTKARVTGERNYGTPTSFHKSFQRIVALRDAIQSPLQILCSACEGLSVLELVDPGSRFGRLVIVLRAIEKRLKPTQPQLQRQNW